MISSKNEGMKQVAYSINQAAVLLGVSRSTIVRALDSGELKAAKVASRTWRISAVELQQFWEGRGGGKLWPEGWPGLEEEIAEYEFTLTPTAELEAVDE